MIDPCPACGKHYKSDASEHCSFCGAPRPITEFNHCLNSRCDNYNVDLGSDDRYCDICGGPTVIGKKVEDLI